MTPDQQDKIDRLKALQERLRLSDKQFVQQLRVGSETTWNQIKNGKYPGDLARQLANFNRAAAQLQQRMAKDRVRPQSQFFEFMDQQAVLGAVDDALNNGDAGDERKLVWFVADTGGGKDALASHLVAEREAHHILARTSWRKSYLAALKTIARAVGLQEPKRKWTRSSSLEEEIISRLQERPRLLILNEIEFMGRDVLNLIRTILNETRCAILMLCVPAFYRDIFRFGDTYADQLRRRTVAIVEETPITPAQAVEFLRAYAPDKVPASEERSAAKTIAEAARSFGRYDALRWISDEINRGSDPDAACAHYKSQLALKS